jgi:hypothetical protein
VLTDNGAHFTIPGAGGSAAPLIAEALAKDESVWADAFADACSTPGIEHRITKPKQPWTNGQVEWGNHTVKDAAVKRCHYDSHDQFAQHLADVVSACNFGWCLRNSKGLAPCAFICKYWTSQPQRFKPNPLQQMPGPDI